MIQAQNGLVKTEGSNLELIEDFNCIIDLLMQTNPEIFIGSCTSWSEIVLNNLSKCDKEHLDTVQKVSNLYIKLNVKEKADND